MMTADQARTLVCAGSRPREEALVALARLGEHQEIDDLRKARRLVLRACAIHEQMLSATALQMISAKGRRLDRIPLGDGDYASGSYRLAVALANGLRAAGRRVLAVAFRPDAPVSLYKDQPWLLEHVDAYPLGELSLDAEGQKRELEKESLPMSQWDPENLSYQRLLRQCSESLERAEWLAQKPVKDTQ